MQEKKMFMKILRSEICNRGVRQPATDLCIPAIKHIA